MLCACAKCLYSHVIVILPLKSRRVVLRLPPYDRIVNPNELIRNQLKGYIARHTTSYAVVPDMKQLIKKVVNERTLDEWVIVSII